MPEPEEGHLETIEEIREHYGFADGQKVSIIQVRELYEAEDVELSAVLTFISPFGKEAFIRLSLYKGEGDDEDDFSGESRLQINVESRPDDANSYDAFGHGFLENNQSDGWSFETVSLAFGVPMDAEVWEINEVG
jgi:hypothetical protein